MRPEHGTSAGKPTLRCTLADGLTRYVRRGNLTSGGPRRRSSLPGAEVPGTPVSEAARKPRSASGNRFACRRLDRLRRLSEFSYGGPAATGFLHGKLPNAFTVCDFRPREAAEDKEQRTLSAYRGRLRSAQVVLSYSRKFEIFQLIGNKAFGRAAGI
jgi:hypothetical protein